MKAQSCKARVLFKKSYIHQQRKSLNEKAFRYEYLELHT